MAASLEQNSKMQSCNFLRFSKNNHLQVCDTFIENSIERKFLKNLNVLCITQFFVHCLFCLKNFCLICDYAYWTSTLLNGRIHLKDIIVWSSATAEKINNFFKLDLIHRSRELFGWTVWAAIY